MNQSDDVSIPVKSSTFVGSLKLVNAPSSGFLGAASKPS